MRKFQAIVLLLALSLPALPAPASFPAPEPVIGDWEGVIKIGDVKLRLVLHITDSAKGLTATFDSPDQKTMGMPVDKIEVKGQRLAFEIAAIQATYTGTLDKTGTSLTGSWSQLGTSLPLNFQKTVQAKR